MARDNTQYVFYARHNFNIYGSVNEDIDLLKVEEINKSYRILY